MSKLVLIAILLLFTASASLDLTGFNVYPLEANSRRTSLHVAKGESFALRLPSNPTTGYSWVLVNNDELKSSNVLAFLSENAGGEYESKPHRSGMVGLGGNSYFKFQGVNGGKSSIQFDYKRPWETESINSVLVDVSVD